MTRHPGIARFVLRAACLFALLAVPIGCGSSATVHTRSGKIYEGEILNNDGRYVYVQDYEYHAAVVPVWEITEVKHPGTDAIAWGIVLVALGAGGAFLAAIEPCEPDQNREPSCESTRLYLAAVSLTAFGVPGASLITYGLLTRAASVDRLETIRGPKRKEELSGLSLEVAF